MLGSHRSGTASTPSAANAAGAAAATSSAPASASAAAAREAGHVDHLLARLRAAGLKMTPQRIAIVRQIACDESHPSAQELFERLKPSSPTMSFATVYNTLAALCSAGLGVSLSLAPGSARFDPNMRPHDHVVCDRCGAIRDVLAEPTAPAAAPRASSRARRALAKAAPGFEVRAVEQIFRGLCIDCAREAIPSRRAPKGGPKGLSTTRKETRT
jgi:Fe2+ or Zn2+ uptake regulation protein